GPRGQVALPRRAHVHHGPLPVPRSPPYALCAPRVRPRAPEDVRRTSGHGRPGPLLSTGGSTRDARSSGTTNRPPRRGRGPPLGRLRSGRLRPPELSPAPPRGRRDPAGRPRPPVPALRPPRPARAAHRHRRGHRGQPLPDADAAAVV